MSQEKIWALIARKLAGEASEEDQRELEQLIAEDPQLSYQFHLIAQLWTVKPPDTIEADKQNLQRLLTKINEVPLAKYKETGDGYKNRKMNFMVRNYLKMALRNLVKNRMQSFVNIAGLSVGLAVTALIGLWIWSELSFNRQFKNYDRIATVMQNQTFNGEVQTWNGQAMQLGPELRNEYGDQFKQVVMASWTGDHLLAFDDKRVMKSGNYMEPGIVDMLQLKMIKGTGNSLQDPHSLLLSESTAKALFGKTDPVNKTVLLDTRLPVKITGVYKDLPYNSSFGDLTFIAPWQLMINSDSIYKTVTWGNSWFQVFVQIADRADMARASERIKYAKLKRVMTEDDDARFKPELFLHPMNRWHLYDGFKNGVNAGGNIQYVRLFGIIGAFVLLLACINFMNLSTARSEKRAKEVGILKTIGSSRYQVVGQLFSESLLVAACSSLLALLLIQCSLPFFNLVTQKKIALPWNNWLWWLAGILFTVITGIIAGLYPALYLSSFRPIKVLKGTFKAGRLAVIPRKALVVIQFTVSVILIIGTTVAFRQIRFAKERPVGYHRTGLISVSLNTDDAWKHYEVLRNDLIQTGTVQEVAASETPVTAAWVTNSGFNWLGKDPGMQDEFTTMQVTPEFGKTINWEIMQGRNFSRDFASDSSAFIINEAAARYMGLKNPVGKIVKWGENGNYRIIGVIKDMVLQSPYAPVRQMIFYMGPGRLGFVNIRVNPQVSMNTALKHIETVFRKYDPQHPFEYRFTDQEYAKKFDNEERIGTLTGFFAGLAIFISCLGLFGLASFMAAQRIKEIGIRKVLGASVLSLCRMLSKEFVMLVLLAVFIATPVAWHYMNGWLQQYNYHTELSLWIFVVAGGGVLLITLLTVSFQAIKAAIANPVKALRSE